MVPTVYTDIRGRVIHSNQVLLNVINIHFMLFIHCIILSNIVNVIPQYSVTEHFKSSELGAAVPGVFFFYDISPIKVRVLFLQLN